MFIRDIVKAAPAELSIVMGTLLAQSVKQVCALLLIPMENIPITANAIFVDKFKCFIALY